MSSEDGPDQAPAPGRIALRSPLEAFLWIFVTRLVALLTASRSPTTANDPAGPADATADGPVVADDRARRVAASRPPDGAGSGPPATAGTAKVSVADAATRAAALTAAASVVAGAAAFAAGRRRGRR